MKKIASFICFFSLTFCSVGQIPLIFSDNFPDSAKTRIGIAGDYILNSTAFTTEFISKFYKGGYIDENLKNRVLDRTRNTNRVGAELNYGIYGAFTLDSLMGKEGFSVFFSVRNREHFDALYSKDFYKVGFYGNAQYAGQTANMNNFNLNLIRYQQVQLGLFSNKLDSAARWGIGVSFLKGEQYATILAKKAEMFTSEDGQYIDFNTSFEVAQSDTANTGAGAFNGYGASVDIYFQAPFNTRMGDARLSVSVSDIGLIRFNEKSLYMSQDSVFHYTGFNVNSMYDLQDSTFSGFSQDSITNSVVPFKKRSFTATIPSTLNITYETELSKRFHLTEGIRYIFNGNYALLAYLKGNYYFNKNFMISATAGYGGYGNFSYGLGIYANLGKGLVVYAGSNNIEGFIAPTKTCGQGAYISIAKNFN
ncbi:MAG: hypothetical protein M3R27_09785 [Bacteroidota bacterium]|nr:hypothetical protein [Bacteroidota bacterium]